VWHRQHIVTFFDDHDQVRKGNNKGRFCAEHQRDYEHLPAVLAVNLLTMGIPCLYYGSEQAFDGGNSDWDGVLRECMFGGTFGSFVSEGKHFFNEDHKIYVLTKTLIELRKKFIALRRGRQYLRQTSESGDDNTFGFPTVSVVDGKNQKLLAIIAWSRLFTNGEMLIAINTDIDNKRKTWVTIQSDLHHDGDFLERVFSTDDAITEKTTKVCAKNGKAVCVVLPPGGIVIYNKYYPNGGF